MRRARRRPATSASSTAPMRGEPPPAPPALRCLLLAQLRLPPLEDRLGEDVVEELVAASRLAGWRSDGAEDAAALAAAELLEHGRDLRLGPLRPLGEVGGRVGDLRLRAGDEEAEEVGGDGLLGGRELAERFEQVVLDDLLRTAERLAAGRASSVCAPAVDRRRARAARARAGGTAPRPRRRSPPRRGAVAALGEPEPAGGGRLDHRRRPAPARPRTAPRPGGRRRFHSSTGPVDRLARRLAVEVLDADVVREQGGDAALEAVELRPARPRGARARSSRAGWAR